LSKQRRRRLDRLDGDEQLLGDLAIGAPLGREPRDAQLGRGQRVDARGRRAPRAQAEHGQLVARATLDRPRAAAAGQVQRGAQALLGGPALAAAAQRSAEVGQRARVLGARRRALEHPHRAGPLHEPRGLSTQRTGAPPPRDQR
jgi:hypothetical protein